MTFLEIKLRLSDNLARQAEAEGLLTPEAISNLIQDEIERRQLVDQLFTTADRLAALDVPPLTDSEVEAEIGSSGNAGPSGRLCALSVRGTLWACSWTRAPRVLMGYSLSSSPTGPAPLLQSPSLPFAPGRRSCRSIPFVTPPERRTRFIRNRLFRPFDTTRGNAGMGIGMYESREFIRHLGGEVYVQSVPGGGTTISLHIPVSPEQPAVELMSAG